uniref:Heat shock factor protein n=1 Tax=Saccharum hybrid cultivar R570 TaxID=131158 RepID=A0A059Q2G2_9POAL|nr:heat shock factor protein [Saccharum hybrid cultivar R570]
MEAYVGAAPAAGVFAGYGTAATRPFILRLRRRRRVGGGSPRSSAGRVRLVRAPPPRATGDAGDLPPLDKWDIMELDFGRFLGEDPKLTLAKILLKKSDPDASSLDVEKLIATKKDKLDDILRECMEANKKDPGFNTSESGSPLNTTRPTISKPTEAKSALNISRPVMGKPIQDGPPLTLLRPAGSKPKQDEPSLAPLRPVGSKANEDTPSLILSRPIGSKPKVRGTPVQDSWPSKESLAAATEFSEVGSISRTNEVDVTLRKPAVYQSEDDDLKSKLKIKPNINLKMRKDMNEDLTNISLLQKPDAAKDTSNLEQDNASASPATVSATEDNSELEPESNGLDEKLVTENVHESSGLDDDSTAGLQPSGQTFIQETSTSAGPVDNQSATSNTFSMQAFLQGKPKGENQSAEILPSEVDEKMNATDNKNYVDDGGNVLPSKLEDITESDWTRLEHYASTGEKVEVELINCSAKGFVVSLDSLIGFLPYRNLATKWKFLAFETWLRRKGGDPSLYKQSLGLVDSFEVNDRNIEPESSPVFKIAGEDQESLSSKPKFEDLIRAYNQEKSKFLSSFIGQARLNVGDIVQCTIKRFVYFGIFVEVEGVPALIQQWEVSWDDTLDPAVSYKIGQVVDAKVIQLDYNNSRIFLSLKDVKPNPSIGALEAVIGEDVSLGGALEPVQADFEWPEVDALMEELRKIEGVRDVYKGRFFQSPGLAPTFQVYMATVVGPKYKLLARYGNNVQEVMVETTLGKEELKEAILMCTNRVS